MAADGMVKNIDRLFEELGTASLKRRIFSWKAIRILGQEAHEDYDLLIKEHASAEAERSELRELLEEEKRKVESRDKELDGSREDLAEANLAHDALVGAQKEKEMMVVELAHSGRSDQAIILELRSQLTLANIQLYEKRNEVQAYKDQLQVIDRVKISNPDQRTAAAEARNVDPFGGINKTHIESALKTIDKEGVPRARAPKRWVLKDGNTDYPPKYVLSMAGLSVHGGMHDRGILGVNQANDFLTQLGYTIIDKNTGIPWE
ncbi:MAG TPA: hypothetical protein VGK23_00875 [Methanomassiliicoccales archaeon]|jgi:hypothetical protein